MFATENLCIRRGFESCMGKPIEDFLSYRVLLMN